MQMYWSLLHSNLIEHPCCIVCSWKWFWVIKLFFFLLCGVSLLSIYAIVTITLKNLFAIFLYQTMYVQYMWLLSNVDGFFCLKYRCNVIVLCLTSTWYNHAFILGTTAPKIIVGDINRSYKHDMDSMCFADGGHNLSPIMHLFLSLFWALISLPFSAN